MTEKIELSQWKKIFFTLFSVVVYRVVLDYVYIRIIYPHYKYEGLVFHFSNLVNNGKYLISWLVLLPVPFIIYRNGRKENMSGLVWTLLLLLNYVPASVMYAYNELSFYKYYVLYFIVFTLALELIKPIRIKINESIAQFGVNVIGVALAASVWLIWIYYAHCHVQLSILDVYGTRAEAGSYTMPTILSYAFSMSKNVIPIFAMYFLYCRNYSMAVFYILTQLINFCIDGSKGTFFIILVSFAVYFLIGKVKDYRNYFPGILALGGIAGLCQYKFTGSYTIVSLFYRRMMFVPNYLNACYFDYFSKNESDYFRTSFSIFGQSPYTSISKIIGETYLYDGISCNNGLFSDAFANLGFAGMVVMPILNVLILKLLDGATVGLPEKIYVVSAVEVALLLISSFFFTNMLSHGIALMIVVLYMMNTAKVRDADTLKVPEGAKLSDWRT